MENDTMANTETRSTAIGQLVGRFLNEKHMLRQDVARTDIVAAIQELAPMGRTQRWADAVKRWADMVQDHPLNMDWALLQGQVFALHAA